ncbi:unnamed protein product [Owenia fusiformis]|uniref:Uncharacterized protein n=1 Tax=Owenia fusiformis TaxID=6347 RepID=A0A8J1Y7F4_OWEFU|nr:unnamed protein product [Owenia fusiformis]
MVEKNAEKHAPTASNQSSTYTSEGSITVENAQEDNDNNGTQGSNTDEGNADKPTAIEVKAVPNESAGACAIEAQPSTSALPAEERHIQPEHFTYMVILKFDDTYLKTVNGIMRLLQVVISLVALVTTLSAGWESGMDIYEIPQSWRIRVFIFITSLTFLTSLLFLFIQVTSLIDMFRQLPWALIDLVIYSVYSVLYLVGGSIICYTASEKFLSTWTSDQLYITTGLAYLCVMLYAYTAVAAYKRWRTCAQYQRYRLKDIIQSAEEEF